MSALACLGVKQVPVHDACPKEEDVGVLSDHAIDQARTLKPGALSLGFPRGDDPRDAKMGEELLHPATPGRGREETHGLGSLRPIKG